MSNFLDDKNVEISSQNRTLKSKIRLSKRKDSTLQILFYVFLGFYCIVSVYPFFWALIASFTPTAAIPTLGINPLRPVMEGGHLSTENYDVLFKNSLTHKYIGQWITNSVIYSTANATINCFFNFLAGYALARISFKGKKAVIWYILVALMVPVQATQIPQYFLLIQFGIINPNTPNWVFFIGILSTGMTSGILIFMIRQFYMNQNSSIEEAGKIDGLNDFKVFIKISIRLLIPLLATQWAMIFIGSWNNFILFTLWATGDPDRLNMTSAFTLMRNPLEGPAGEGRTIAALNISIIPVLVVYMGSLYFQRKTTIDGEK